MKTNDRKKLNNKEIRKSVGQVAGMDLSSSMEYNTGQTCSEKLGRTRSFQRFRGFEDMKETEIGTVLRKIRSDEYLKLDHNTKTVKEMPIAEVCYVAENVATSHGDVKRYKEKRYVKFNSVPSEHVANMELDNDVSDEKNISDGINDVLSENDQTSCVCKCHCRRNYQKHGLTRKPKLKSSRNDRNYSSDKLQNHSRRNKTIGVIKANESSETLFRTRLKSENSSERSSVCLSEGHKRCINLVCVRLRRNMAKILCHCAILLLLCLCGGVVMVHLNEDKTDNSVIQNGANVGGFKSKVDTFTSKESSILLNQEFKSVPKDVFQKHLSKSKSAAEMLKIFFSDPSLTEEQVNSIMYMKQHQINYGSKSMDDELMMGDEGGDQNYREIAYQHYLDFERNPLADCNEPRPEVVRIDDVSSESVLHFLPSCTIVHRCRNHTACCPRGHVCAPKQENGIELIEKFFMVLEAVPGSDKLQPAKDFIAAKTFINHTACECQKVDIDSNCQKRCPNQFTKTRPGVNCECECGTGHRKCHRIHKGLLPLDEKDLECIKEDKCIVPSCHSGKFSISSGFCPHFRRFRKSL